MVDDGKSENPLRRLPHAARLPLPQYMTRRRGGDGLSGGGGKRGYNPARGLSAHSTGLQVALPEGFEGQIRPRSGLAARFGVTVLNAPGPSTVITGGEIQVLLVNHGPADFVVSRVTASPS